MRPRGVTTPVTTAVLDAQPAERGDRRLASLLATGFAAVTVFQLCLAAGAPWGAAAWGGADLGRLSAELRVASAFAACFWLLAALTALARGGIAASPVPYAFSRHGTWALTALLALGAVMNGASQSHWERFGWAPIIFGLAVLSLRLSRSGRGGSTHLGGTSAPTSRLGRPSVASAPGQHHLRIHRHIPRRST